MMRLRFTLRPARPGVKTADAEDGGACPARAAVVRYRPTPMKALACRLYGEYDLRLEPIDLEPAGDDAVIVELVSNSVCMSDYKAVSLGTKHRRVPKDIATNPIMVGHEVCGIVREVGTRWRDQFHVGQRVGVQPAFNIPGRELETMGYAWPTMGGDTTHIRVPAIIIEQGCLLPYEGDGPFFACSLAEPVSCIVSALRTSYHNEFNSHVHRMGVRQDGTMLLLAGGGAMGLAAIDIACHNPESRPRRLVVTDLDEGRLARAAQVFGLGPGTGGACASGRVGETEVHIVDARGLADPVAALKSFNLADDARAGDATSTGGGYDDVLVFAAVPALIAQASALLGFGGCLNFFAGPTDQGFTAPFNFYGVHYLGHHCVGSSGGDVKDMADSIDWISRGILHPEVMVTHVGGLDSAAEATATLPKVPGGKRLVYTHLSLPMTPIADFARLGETDPMFAELARICEAHRGLWSREAEDFLLARAPKLA